MQDKGSQHIGLYFRALHFFCNWLLSIINNGDCCWVSYACYMMTSVSDCWELFLADCVVHLIRKIYTWIISVVFLSGSCKLGRQAEGASNRLKINQVKGDKKNEFAFCSMQRMLCVTQVRCRAYLHMQRGRGELLERLESYYSPLLPFDHLLRRTFKKITAILCHLDSFPFITPHVAFLVFGLLACKDDKKETVLEEETSAHF